MKNSFALIPIEVLEYTDYDFPLWVRCRLEDGVGNFHFFTEKSSVISQLENLLLPTSSYIQAEIVKVKGRTTIINTGEPYGIESEEGESIFSILTSKVKFL